MSAALDGILLLFGTVVPVYRLFLIGVAIVLADFVALMKKTQLVR